MGVTVDGQCDQRGPDRDAADVVLRAVNRVDDPGPASAHRAAVLFANEGVVGPVGLEVFAQRPLDGLVGIGHRGHVGLGGHDEVPLPVAAHADAIGDVGEVLGEREIRHGIQGIDPD